MAQVPGFCGVSPCPSKETFIAEGAQQPKVALCGIVDPVRIPSTTLRWKDGPGSTLYRPHRLPERRVQRVNLRGKVRLRKLLPDTIGGLEINRMELPAAAYMPGVPHTPGTREYLTCESGKVQLSVSGESWDLEPGDVVVFRGDQKHGYRNLGNDTAIAYSVVALAPAGLAP